ncbi:MAG: bacteriophage abortive infection AbiH family protein [Clostridiales bacterium]|nr:bacteriophage abortive infection AbiH family protein [Clostridiales bacterium]
MSIFYDEKGFAHETEKRNYNRNGFPAPLFDNKNGRMTEYFSTLLRKQLRLRGKGATMEEYVFRSVWEDFTEIPQEVYIMVGNGFDLECGLPTGYRDFLNFLDAVERLDKNPDDKLENVDISPEIKALIGSHSTYDIWKPIIESYWYDHFRRSKLKHRWIDFEAEISKVIQTIEYNMDLKRYNKASMDDYVSCYEGSEISRVIGKILMTTEVVEEETLQDGTKYTVYKLLYRDLRDRLLEDLSVLTRGFETYLREYVEKIDVTLTENIKFLMDRLEESTERYVLSFNYTTTFERILNDAGIKAEFCYVHGRIGDGKTKNRMVLGIDEYLEPEKIRDLIGYAPFRKYNQRIFKGTDSNYMDWLDYIAEGKTLDRMLYIFGHSIGITDKDIIGAFVKANDMRSVLFYHSEDAFSDQVSNLTAIIGMEEMIRRTGGKTHTLEFRKQK